MFVVGAAVATALIVGLTFGAGQAVGAIRAEAHAVVEKARAPTEKANAQAAEWKQKLAEFQQASKSVATSPRLRDP